MATTNDAELARKIEALRSEEAIDPTGREASMLSAQRLVHRALVYPKTTMLAQSVFRWLVHHRLLVGSSATAELRLSPAPGFSRR